MPHTMTFKHESATAKIIALDKFTYAVSNVHAKDRNKGHASELMRQIIDFADRNEKSLCLVVQQFGYSDRYSPDNAGLISFYEKFGFHRDAAGWPITMRRNPSQKLHGS